MSWHDVHVPRLRKELGFKSKIPSQESFFRNDVNVHNTRGEYMGMYGVKVDESSTIGSFKRRPDGSRNWKGAGKHRMHLLCKECGQWVPAGRLGQHYRYKHGEK